MGYRVAMVGTHWAGLKGRRFNGWVMGRGGRGITFYEDLLMTQLGMISCSSHEGRWDWYLLHFGVETPPWLPFGT